MPTDIPLRCACGRVRGHALDATPESTSHVICYCDDCQAYARWLDVPGVADEHGGTEIFQLPPARFRITEGVEELRSMRLSEGGLLRWYAACCRTPVANTVNARVPFVGIPHAFVEGGIVEGAAAALAPPAAIWGMYAIGSPPTRPHPKGPPLLILRFASNLFRWWVSGQSRPSALFDASGAPRARPTVVAPDARAKLAPPAAAR